ncbi:Endoplasmic reticulum mannosyl-oligosaccharide 1,2-alpha-mannosidase [Orchesella cincta]|uniref:alpha-1,2-Mannosidase n=1 Tax=Orchesella cincta TaxID=48709 RepID=A0A1D2NLH9_ORCCI|nr:Endoplasmic reticulum mannosyl-oligosaccharide 1,2-alpha-mannosidase [Orchesella cincta]
MTMEDVPYTSIFVTNAADTSQDSLGKSRSTSLSCRRHWNRLSRLQKSFIFMLLLIVVSFCLISTTFTWAPDASVAEDDLLRNKFHALPLSNQNPGASRRNEHGSAFSRNMGVPSNAGLPTMSRQLQPDIEPSRAQQLKVPEERSKEIKQQVAENIRSVISLDPVIPISKRKRQTKKPPMVAVKTDYHRLKLDGPKNQRQQEVVNAFLHAWKGYKTFAWGQDHLRPISKTGQDWFGLALTLIDSLDTMYIMGLQKEYFEARDWVDNSLSFDLNRNVNLFETTIRVMGGLLSAYHLSGDEMFRHKAEDLGNILLAGFKSPSGVPYSDVNLRNRVAHGPSWSPDSTTSEVTTIQLEFRDLSRIVNNPIFEESAMNVSKHVHTLPKTHGLVPIHITPGTGSFRMTSVITLGARGDSYYEYLLKQWIQTGKKIDFLRDDYLLAVDGIQNRLVQRTHLSNLTFINELENNGQVLRPKMDHLVCYLPGTLALGVLHGLPQWHLDLAKDLLYTCYLTYKRQPTGLSPEITFFNTEESATHDFWVKHNDAHNLLRPETVESLWYLWQITGDKMYQDWGWEIFQSFLKYTRVEHGFTSISSVLNPENTRPRDMMESFFLGETLKYFYLLFSDKPIFDLKTWVFNTEAHPLPVYDH